MHTFQPKQPTLGKNKNLYLLPYSNDLEWKASKAPKCIFKLFLSLQNQVTLPLKKKKTTYMATTVLIQRKNCR